MKRPVLKICTIAPREAKAREAVKITVGIQDLELIFGTEHSYAAGPRETEVYEGEEETL